MSATTGSPARPPGNSFWRRRLAAALTISLSLIGLAAVTIAPNAQAVSCSTPVKYSSTSNTIYLPAADPYTANGAWSLSDIKATCAGAPLTQPSPGVWELSADLVLNNGTALSLHGSKASSPGDVDTLRLRSLSDNAKTHVSAITAHWGTIEADSVTITSWDNAAGAADTNPNLATGSLSTDRGRAFIRVQSYVDATTGAARLSTMTINNSTVTRLGYYASESYGVSWKSLGCSHLAAGFPICAKAPVAGGAMNSTFTDDYMGGYVWGGQGMTFTGNTFANNFMYGLDTHDVTTNLLVKDNTFRNNGDHALICAERCDNLNIISNRFEHNGVVPFSGPVPTGDAVAREVHAIMLFRGITNTSITSNTVTDQRTGAGIAVLDSSGNTIANNIIDGALYGIRLSVGSAANTFTNNTVKNTTTNTMKYGLQTFKGNDVPAYSTASGHPTGNVFTSNSFSGSTTAIKLGETDGTKFSGTTFGGGILHADASAGTVITGGVNGERVEVTGTSAEPTTFTVADPDPVVSVVAAIADPFSTVHVTSKGGRLYLVAGKWFSASVSTTKSDVKLTLAKVVTTSGVTVAPTKVTVVPDSGKITAKARTTPTGATEVSISPASSSQGINVSITGLTPSHPYKITSKATSAVTAGTTSSGTLTFTDLGLATIYTVSTT